MQNTSLKNYLFIIILAGFFISILFIREYFISINGYNVVNSDEKCYDLNKNIPNLSSLFFKEDSSWNYKLGINENSYLNVHVRCPSAWTEVEVITTDNKIVSRTKTHNILTEYYIDDCHDKPKFIISTEIDHGTSNKKFNYVMEQEIYSPHQKTHFGYLGLQDKMAGYVLTDLDGIPHAFLNRTGIDNNIKWVIDIKDHNSKLSDLDLILSIIGKKSFQKWLTYDNCNKSFMFINMIYDISVVLIPICGVLLLLSLFYNPKGPISDDGVELQNLNRGDKIDIEDTEIDFEYAKTFDKII